MMGCTGDANCVGEHLVHGGDEAEFHWENFEGWNICNNLITAIHGVFVMHVGVWGHCNHFFVGDWDHMKSVEEHFSQCGVMGDAQMNGIFLSTSSSMGHTCLKSIELPKEKPISRQQETSFKKPKLL